MPSSLNRILKHARLADGPEVRDAADLLSERSLRIPSERVVVPTPPGDEDAYRLAGVLRGTTSEHVREVPALEAEFVSDFPLPDDVSAGLRARAPQPEPEPDPEPEPPPVDVAALRAEWEAEWQARRDEAVAAARAEGVAEGRAAALHELEQEHQARLDAFAADAAHLQTQWTELMKQAEPRLADLALAVAQSFVEGPLPDYLRAIPVRALSDAVERLAAEPPVEVTLHPVDLLRMQESGLLDQLTHGLAGVRVMPNPEIKPGEWIVQSAAAAVRSVRAELMEQVRRQLGLLTSDALDTPDA